MEDWQMKINWGRVLNAGLIAEILLLLIYQFAVQLYGRGLASNLVVVIGCFVFMLIGALWVGRKIESRFILHGFLVGVVAVAYYVIRSLPDALSGQYPMNYWLAAVYGHTPKLLGGIVGGYIAARRKAKAV
jgi:putative membrane protein (TIGR04086 family)